MLGKIDHSFSDSSLGAFYDGGYTEVVFGYAFRPVRNDRFNALAKYTFFDNVPSPDQVGVQNTPVDFLQRSHIVSTDFSYDVTAAWTLGVKYAFRMGQVSLDRVNPAYFDNAAHLGIARADWRFRKNWEGMVEGRVLDLPDVHQQRGGALVGLYRYIGKHVKIGAGYNFTNFSDDLTDLSYKHQGVFVNVVGTVW